MSDPAGRVRFLAPVPDAPSIRDFYAFEEHVKTSAQALGREVTPVWYEILLFYFTNPAATRGPYDDIPIAPGSSRFDYELEIAAVGGTVGTGCILELSAVGGPEAYPWLKPGDQVRLEVDRLGVIGSTIRPSAPVIPLRP